MQRDSEHIDESGVQGEKNNETYWICQKVTLLYLTGEKCNPIASGLGKVIYTYLCEIVADPQVTLS